MSSGHTGNWFKRAERSLLGGKQRLTGNHVSPSKRKVRRVWLPNVHMKRLWSDVLDRHIRINVTPYTLKIVDRMGGIDNYLLYTRPDKLHSRTGLVLRRILEDQIAFRARVEAKYGGGRGGSGAESQTLSMQDAIAATLAEIEASQEPLVSEGDLKQQGGDVASSKAQELR